MTQTVVEPQEIDPDGVFDLNDDVFNLDHDVFELRDDDRSAELTPPEQTELSNDDDVFDLDPKAAEAVVLEETVISEKVIPNDKQDVAQLKLFGNGSGAMLFGDAAIAVAEKLGVETKLASNDAPSLKLKADQFEAATAILEDQGWTVEMVEPKESARIALHGNTATVYGSGAKGVAEMLGLPLGETATGNPKVKIDGEQVDQASMLLRQAGYSVKTEEIVNRSPPIAVFRAHPDGNTYSVFDGSAKNVAKALGQEADKTPGGRAVIYFTGDEYKEVKSTLKEKGFNLSLKDLDLKAKISTFFKDDSAVGAVITGAAALEAAGSLGLETGYTKPGGKSNTCQPKLVVSGIEQIASVKSVLEAQEYSVDVVQLPALKIANERILPTGSAAYFGEPAKLAAAFLGVKPGATRQGTAMVEVKQDEIAATRETLKEQGYEIRSEVYKPPVQSAQKTLVTSKPKIRAGGGER